MGFMSSSPAKSEVATQGTHSTPKPVDVNEVNRLAQGAYFKGDLVTENDVRIDGHLEGRLFSGARVVVGEKAIVDGDIYATVVDFGGTMQKGNIYAKETLFLQSGCRVEGDLFFNRFQVEIGASFTGTCQVLGAGEYDRVAAPLKSMLQPKAPASSNQSKFNNQ